MTRMVHLLVAAAALGAGSRAIAESLADPMRPSYVRAAPVVKSGDGALYRLQAIFGNRSGRIAVVNGRVLRSGERIGDAVIHAIGANYVEIRRGKRRWIERLPAVAQQ